MNVPFHMYSMRQAIEEGYILDVLANYITYDLKWRLRNLAVEQQESLSANPEVDERKASGNWSGSRCGIPRRSTSGRSSSSMTSGTTSPAGSADGPRPWW